MSMSNVLLSLPLPVLLALIGVVLGMLVLARALARLSKPAQVREAAEHAPHLRLVIGGRGRFDDGD
jgi:heme A synthase